MGMAWSQTPALRHSGIADVWQEKPWDEGAQVEGLDECGAKEEREEEAGGCGGGSLEEPCHRGDSSDIFLSSP